MRNTGNPCEECGEPCGKHPLLGWVCDDCIVDVEARIELFASIDDEEPPA